MRITIGKQILWGCIMVVIAFTGLNMYTYYQIDTIQVGYDGVFKRSVPLVIDVHNLNTELNNQESLVRGYILTGNPKYIQDYNASQQTMNGNLTSLEKNLITPEGKEKVAGLKAVLSDYHQAADQRVAIRNTSGQ